MRNVPSAPTFLNWENSTYARAYCQETNPALLQGHTQVWGVDTALTVALHDLASVECDLSHEVQKASHSNARIMLEDPPDKNLPTFTRHCYWLCWWSKLVFVHLPIRIMVLPFDLPHHDLHHSHAIHKAANKNQEK